MANLFQKKGEAERDSPQPTGMKTEEVVGDETQNAISLAEALLSRTSEKRSTTTQPRHRDTFTPGVL